jgi:hypothetical protein
MIDCSDAIMDCGVQFWSQALGLAVRQTEGAASPYVGLSGDSGVLQLQLQRVNAESRFHLDIETDDVEAEVQRLEQLGARRLAHVSSWWVMQAPTGHHFCVVPAGSAQALAQANVWSAETSH